MRFPCALLIIATLTVAACDSGGSGGPTPIVAATARFTHGVASGDVRPNSAVLWTRAKGGDRVKAEVSPDPGLRVDTVIFAYGDTSAARDFTVKVKINGLTPDTLYHYRFIAGDATSETGTFVTAPDAAASKPLRSSSPATPTARDARTARRRTTSSTCSNARRRRTRTSSSTSATRSTRPRGSDDRRWLSREVSLLESTPRCGDPARDKRP
jgi:hypothetical protein